MQSDLTEFDETIKERPVFLKTLCMLTFIFSVFTIISNIISVVNPERAANMIITSKKKVNEDLNNHRSDQKNVNLSKKILGTLSGFSADIIRKSAIGSIISAIFCLAGAFLMWKLKRVGYYSYIIGIIISIAIPFYFFGNNFIGVFAYASAAFFGVLFLIFYGMNLKSMD